MDSRARRALTADQADLLRQIPSVDELLAQPRLAALTQRVDRELLVEIARTVLADLRGRITGEGTATVLAMDSSALEARIVSMVERVLASSLEPVINATGVILHTNLGRAPLSGAAVEEIRRSATSYSNLEYDLEAGARGKRDVHVAQLLERLTGAEAAIVVNNCAAAVLLVLAALAKGGEVIVSRGELIEIGDGFRIPEIMAQSGAVLREVGTTNRTRIVDYENGINENTRLLLRVHPSNFTITGCAEKPSMDELVSLGQRVGLPLVEDLGSGCLVDLSSAGITEPTVRQSVNAGVSIVMFSGDKLLGGPQAGIIAGKKEMVGRVRKHPLYRALRVDKLTIAALQVTLSAALRGAWEEIPALHMIRIPLEEIARRADNFLAVLRTKIAPGNAHCEITDGSSLAGRGSTPAHSLPTKLIRIRASQFSAAQLEERLRVSGDETPVIASALDEALILDLRTVFPEQESALVARLVAALR